MEFLLCNVAFWTVVIIPQTVYGRGCYQDPKVYIVKLSYEKQLVLLLKAKETCLTTRKIPNTAISGSYCNQTFDNVVCWPDTRAGTVAEQNCPNYINNFDTRAKARRECLPNGQWYVNPYYNQTWTDFTECQHTNDPPVSLVHHLPGIDKLNFIGYSISLTCLVVAVGVMIKFR
ncbi:calcitonin gene-related peptide type 1 receptor-like [Saccostrea cucullata]|uniref:calcitonin gene-related peptide type 1 receptor-like n=1 Tax=Saccostrea cuccullata TaxID=36930 RepID=UPI002ED5D9C5